MRICAKKKSRSWWLGMRTGSSEHSSTDENFFARQKKINTPAYEKVTSLWLLARPSKLVPATDIDCNKLNKANALNHPNIHRFVLKKFICTNILLACRRAYCTCSQGKGYAFISCVSPLLFILPSFLSTSCFHVSFLLSLFFFSLEDARSHTLSRGNCQKCFCDPCQWGCVLKQNTVKFLY